MSVYQLVRMTVRNGFVSAQKSVLKGILSITAGFCCNSKLKKTPKTKISSLYHQQNILELIFEEEISALFGKDIYKVKLHIVKASSHTPKSTFTYCTKKKKII